MIIGFEGILSSGKTISMVRQAYLNKKNKKIISNINLTFADIVMDNELLANFIIRNYQKPKELENFFKDSILMIDEITNLLDARKSVSWLNEKITTFLMMVGKLDCDVLFTFQIRESQVDLRLREICNMYVHCIRTDLDSNPLYFEPRVLPYDILIMCLVELNLGPMGIKRGSYSFNPKEFYNFYNTRELVLLDREKFRKREFAR